MYYIDCHCHLGFYGNRLEDVLANCENNRIKGFVLGGTHPQDWQNQLQIIEQFKQLQIIAVFGIHPRWAVDTSIKDPLNQLDSQLAHCEGIGEIGLDFFHGKTPAIQQMQIGFFKAQLNLAKNRQLPVVIHMVKAHHIGIPILKGYPSVSGIVHGFNSSHKVAEQYLDLGFCLSIGYIGGSSLSLSKLAMLASIPDDRLLIESDSPSSFEGSSPVDILSTAEQLGKIRQQDPEQILANSRDNILRLFNLSIRTK